MWDEKRYIFFDMTSTVPTVLPQVRRPESSNASSRQHNRSESSIRACHPGLIGNNPGRSYQYMEEFAGYPISNKNNGHKPINHLLQTSKGLNRTNIPTSNSEICISRQSSHYQQYPHHNQRLKRSQLHSFDSDYALAAPRHNNRTLNMAELQPPLSSNFKHKYNSVPDFSSVGFVPYNGKHLMPSTQSFRGRQTGNEFGRGYSGRSHYDISIPVENEIHLRTKRRYPKRGFHEDEVKCTHSRRNRNIKRSVSAHSLDAYYNQTGPSSHFALPGSVSLNSLVLAEKDRAKEKPTSLPQVVKPYAHSPSLSIDSDSSSRSDSSSLMEHASEATSETSISECDQYSSKSKKASSIEQENVITDSQNLSEKQELRDNQEFSETQILSETRDFPESNEEHIAKLKISKDLEERNVATKLENSVSMSKHTVCDNQDQEQIGEIKEDEEHADYKIPTPSFKRSQTDYFETRKEVSLNSSPSSRSKLRRVFDLGKSKQKREAQGFDNSDTTSIKSTSSSASFMLRKISQGLKLRKFSLNKLFSKSSTLSENEKSEEFENKFPFEDDTTTSDSYEVENSVSDVTKPESFSVEMKEITTFPRLGTPNAQERLTTAYFPKADILFSEAIVNCVSPGQIGRKNKSILKPSNERTQEQAEISDEALSLASVMDRSLCLTTHIESLSLNISYSGPDSRPLSETSSTVESSSVSSRRTIQFSPTVQVEGTWDRIEYDRRGDLSTCNRLTAQLAQAIKEELNNYKLEEMAVHEVFFTRFFLKKNINTITLIETELIL